MPIHPLNALLSRHLADWQTQPLNLLAPPPDLALDAIQHPQLSCVTTDWRSHCQAQHLGLNSSFFPDALPADLAGINLLFWPKAHQEGFWWLKKMCGFPHATGLIVGENRGGIKAAIKQLSRLDVALEKIDAARHCVLVEIKISESLAGVLAQEGRTQVFTGPDGLQLHALPGTFSQKGMDAGSELLIDALRQAYQPAKTRINTLDLGCGCGLLGAWLMRHWPNRFELTGSDVSGLALASAQQTFAHNQLEGVFLASDIFDQLDHLKGQLDLLISNPPFHTGQATDYDLAQRLILQAPQYLKKDGECWIVANRFLPYAQWLDQAFGHFTKVLETGKFTVYRAQR